MKEAQNLDPEECRVSHHHGPPHVTVTLMRDFVMEWEQKWTLRIENTGPEGIAVPKPQGVCHSVWLSPGWAQLRSPTRRNAPMSVDPPSSPQPPIVGPSPHRQRPQAVGQSGKGWWRRKQSPPTGWVVPTGKSWQSPWLSWSYHSCKRKDGGGTGITVLCFTYKAPLNAPWLTSPQNNAGLPWQTLTGCIVLSPWHTFPWGR